MHSTTLNLINDKLKNERQEILDRVLGYLEGILENDIDNALDYELTADQKNNLFEIKNRSLDKHTDAKLFVKEMQAKYGI